MPKNFLSKLNRFIRGPMFNSKRIPPEGFKNVSPTELDPIASFAHKYFSLLFLVLLPLMFLDFFFEDSGLSAVFIPLAAVFFYGWFRVLSKQWREGKDPLITIGAPGRRTCYVPKKNAVYLNPNNFEWNLDWMVDAIVHELIHASLYKTIGKDACGGYDNISHKVEYWAPWAETSELGEIG